MQGASASCPAALSWPQLRPLLHPGLCVSLSKASWGSGWRLGMGATALPREVTCVGLWMDEKTPPGMAVIHTLSLPPFLWQEGRERLPFSTLVA